jgi:hypothetical protein
MALTPEMVVYMAMVSDRQGRESPLVKLFCRESLLSQFD